MSPANDPPGRVARTHVLLKAATSLDGRIATRTGESQWITSPAARARGRALRATVDAIAVGVETVIADDPRLTARLEGCRNPIRVVFDSRARIPVQCELVRTARETPTWLLATGEASDEAERALTARGVRVERISANPNRRVDVLAALERLRALGVESLLLEGGAALSGSFVDADCIDRVAWFVAPVIIGGAEARSAVAGTGPERLSDTIKLSSIRHEVLGNDLLILGDVDRLDAQRP